MPNLARRDRQSRRRRAAVLARTGDRISRPATQRQSPEGVAAPTSRPAPTAATTDHQSRPPDRVRVRVALLFVYLAMPIDLIPDFIPILGYADDAIVVVLVLRSVCRRVSMEELREAWPGSDDGFAALCQLVRPAAVARARH